MAACESWAYLFFKGACKAAVVILIESVCSQPAEGHDTGYNGGKCSPLDITCHVPLAQ